MATKMNRTGTNLLIELVAYADSRMVTMLMTLLVATKTTVVMTVMPPTVTPAVIWPSQRWWSWWRPL